MLKSYVSLTKPGIIFGNLISVAAGFFLAAKSESTTWSLLAVAMVGVALIIASGCVVNNIFDRDIDTKMARTCNREMVRGAVGLNAAFIYAVALLLAGTATLYLKVNALTTVIVLLGYIFYVFFYTMWYKRTSVYGTAVGSISGAVPPLAGYLAVTDYISLEAVLLFALFCLWQMPHSYAIALFRLQDYRDAGIPVLPVKSGIMKAQRHMKAHVVAFSIVAMALFLCGQSSYEFMAVTALVCLYWLRVTFRTVNNDNYESWSRSVFKASLIVVMALSGIFGLQFALVA